MVVNGRKKRALVASSSSDAASVDQYYSNLFFQSVETLQKKLCVNGFPENNRKRVHRETILLEIFLDKFFF